MASAPFACPYCNAYVTVPADAVLGQRVPCPRCGEAFPYRPRGAAASAPAGVALASAGSAADVRTAPRRWSNRAIAGLVLGVMAVMAVVGLVWALKTVPDRRGRDRKEPIGYLPADVDAVALVQVTRTMDTPAGRDFLKQFGLGPGGGGAIDLEKWTGLRAEDIDLIVLGLKVKSENILPRLTLVVEARQPYDVEAIRKAVQAKRPIERNGKTLHPFMLGAAPAEFWCPTETILVVGLEPNDLDAVPPAPQPGATHLPAALQEVLLNPMAQGASVMLAADTDDWEKRVSPLLVSFVKPALAKQGGQVWSEVRSVGLWLRFDEAIGVRALFRCQDHASAAAVQALLLKNELVEPEAVEVREDVLVTMQTQTTPERVRQLMKRWSGGLPGFRLQ